MGSATAEAWGGFLCTLVQLGETGTKQEAAMAKALRGTWGPHAVFVRGRAELQGPFWQYLSDNEAAVACSWLLLVASAQTYVNMPALTSVLQGLDPSDAWSLRLASDAEAAGRAPRLVSAGLLAACHRRTELHGMAACLQETAQCLLHEVNVPESLGAVVDPHGYHSFSARHPETCLLAVLQVRGWVHLHHIHEAVRQSGGMGRCESIGVVRYDSGPSCPDGNLNAPVVPTRFMDKLPFRLEGTLCIFVPVLLPPDADAAEVEAAVAMARAAHESWATNSTVFVLPPAGEGPRGLLAGLSGLRTTQLPTWRGQQGGDEENRLLLSAFESLRVWQHALALTQKAGTCAWAMKVPVRSYVNALALERRLECFDASLPWHFGATTAAYSPGLEPFMFASEKAGAIFSRAAYASVEQWAEVCLTQWAPSEVPAGSQGFLGDYAFALCLSDLGALDAQNYADIEASFILYDRSAQTLEAFWEHPDSLKQCLLVVGFLESPEDLRAVHGRILWSGWHESVPCVGESQTGKFSISDGLGNKKPYYDERIRLALYYCKAPEMLVLERELAARLDGLNPRSGQGALNATVPEPAPGRSHLCIFVPSSKRQERYVRAAEAAWEHWGTADTFFVSPERLSPTLDPQTLLLDTDIDTDYAHLPVRTFLLFEALGRPEWAGACDWYMKADADSFLNVPLISDRLRCFDPAEPWFLGVPQVAHSSTGAMTRFASGGAGYLVSRGLVPKLAAWAPFCLLQLLQHVGGTGMEDVSLAGCIWKWGHIHAVSYVDPETEAITSEAALNRTRVAEPHEEGAALAVPPCTFVVHSLRPEEVAVARENVERARAQASAGTACRPDAERLRRGSDTIMAPVQAEEPIEGYSWPVYGEREFEVLLRCSEDSGG